MNIAIAQDHSPFLTLPKLVAILSNNYYEMRNKNYSGFKQLDLIIEKIEQLYYNQPDATLAAIHLSLHLYRNTSPLQQTVFGAIIGEFITQHMKIPDAKRHIILKAILTCNLALVEYQALLNQSDKQLNDHLLHRIQQHPLESASILQQAGVTDEHLLTIIKQHHERLDGSGYPNQLTEDDIEDDALLLSLCEFYTAMIDKRAYRFPKYKEAREALQELHATAHPREKKLQVHLIKAIGVYPPGSFVRLANDEIAIVFKRHPKSVFPYIKALFDPEGKPYFRGIYRSPTLEEYHIKTSCSLPQAPSVDLSSLWNEH